MLLMDAPFKFALEPPTGLFGGWKNGAAPEFNGAWYCDKIGAGAGADAPALGDNSYQKNHHHEE